MRLFNVFNPKNLIDKNYYHLPFFSIKKWFNTTWRVRTELIIDLTNVSTNFLNIPIDIFLTSNDIDFSKTTINDIRIVDENKNIINYWIESYDNSYIHIIAMFPELIAANKNKFYIYYNNPTATSISTGSIFDKFEDFEGNGNISRYVSGGVFSISQDYSKNGNNSGKIVFPSSLGDGTFFDIRNNYNDFILEYSILTTKTSLSGVFGTCDVNSQCDSWGESFVYIYNNEILLNNGLNRFSVGAAESFVWYDITEIHHPTNYKYDITIKNGLSTICNEKNLAYYNNYSPNFLKIVNPASGGISAFVYVDNIRVRKYFSEMENIIILFGKTEYL